MKSVKTIVAIIVALLLGLFLFFILNPFNWGMKASPAPKQPALSEAELSLFEEIGKYGKFEINRQYENADGSDLKIDLNEPYYYILTVISENDGLIQRDSVMNNKLANCISQNITDSSLCKGININWSVINPIDKSGNSDKYINWSYVRNRKGDLILQ